MALGNIYDLYVTLGLDSSGYDDGAEQVEKDVNSLSANTVAKGNIIADAVEKAAGSFVSFAKDVVTTGIQQESALAKVNTIMDQTVVSTDEMSSSISDLSTEMGVSVEELSDTVYNAISATGDTANAVSLAAQASKLATAGFTDTSSALSVLTTAMNAYGLSADEAENISDSLLQVQNLGVTTVAELSSAMGKAIASASAYNVDLTNLESAYVSLTKAGINTAESTTYISSMLKELGDNGSDVSAVIEKKTGQSFSELMNSGKSLGDVLQILSDSCDGDSSALMNLWSSAEAGKAANAIVSQGLETFNTNLTKIGNSAGTTETAYETMADTVEHKMEVFQNSLTNMKSSLFKSFEPALEKLMDFVSDVVAPVLETVVTGITEAPTPLKILTAAIAAFAVGLKVIPPIITKVKGAVDGFKLSIGDITLILTAVSAAITVLSGVVNSYTEEANETIESTNTLLETLEDNDKELETSALAADGYAKRLEQLMKVEDKDAGTKAEMVAIVENLNELYPDLGWTIDETTGQITDNTGAVIDNTDAIEENIQAAEKSYKLQKKQEELQDILEQRYEIEEQIEELEDDMANNPNITDAFSLRADKVQELKEQYDELGQEYEENIAYINENTEAENTNAEATANVAEAAATAAASYDTLTETQKSQLETFSSTVSDFNDALSDGISNSLSLFEEFDAGTSTSLQEMVHNMQTQIDGVTNWEQNLQTLIAKGVDEGVVGKLAEAGPSSAAAVAQLVSDIELDESQVATLNSTFTEWMDVEEMSNEMATNLQEVYSTAVSGDFPELQEAMKTSGYNSWASFIEGMSEGASEVSSEVTETASGVATAVTETVEPALADAATTTEQTAESVTQSTDDMGTAMTDVATTTEETVDSVSTSMSSMETAVSNTASSLEGILDTVDMGTPHGSLPSFTLSTSTKDGITYPTGVSVSGYTKFAKAMNEPYILNSPTIFGAMNGKALVGGDAGSEMVVGTDKMMGMISTATQSGSMSKMLMNIYNMLRAYLPSAGNVYLDGNKVSKAIYSDVTKYQNKSAKFSSKIMGVT